MRPGVAALLRGRLRAPMDFLQLISTKPESSSWITSSHPRLAKHLQTLHVLPTPNKTLPSPPRLLHLPATRLKFLPPIHEELPLPQFPLLSPYGVHSSREPPSLFIHLWPGSVMYGQTKPPLKLRRRRGKRRRLRGLQRVLPGSSLMSL